tara:strand:+ start:3386 stop:3901 length:516 start_codon:yes stop_codon:yes gene_type:complete
MVDLETLGTGVNSCILSMGLCAFDTTGEIKAIKHVIVDDPLGTIDKSTVEWWLKQDKAAVACLFDGHAFPLKDALEQFVAFTRAHKCANIWSNGPTFDEIIMRQAWKRARMVDEFPLRFWASRCVRTVKMIRAKLKLPPLPVPPQYGIKHNAAHDAANQALMVIDTLKHVL